MNAVLARLESLAVLIFALSSMFSVGLGHDWRDVIAPLRHPSTVTRALLANFVLVPLLVHFILKVLPTDRALAIGLLLVATAAGAPFLIKLTEAARGDVAFSATLLVLLLPITIVYMPLVLPFALPEADVRAGAIAEPLALTILLPLSAGLAKRVHGVLGVANNIQVRLPSVDSRPDPSSMARTGCHARRQSDHDQSVA